MSCGTRAQQFRPGDPDGVRLLRSSSGESLAHTGYCVLLVPLVMRTAGDLSKRHPSAASPVARPASALAWNPTAEPPGARARSQRLHRGTAYSLHCGVLLTALADTATAVLLMAAPHHCGPPGPVVSPVTVLQNLGFGTPPPHRPAHCNYLYCGYFCRQFISARPCCLSGLREKP
jgi:hypothetical protein